MPVTRIPIDGLLRCLCPSIDAFTTSASAPLLRTRLRPRRCIVRSQGYGLHTTIRRRLPERQAAADSTEAERNDLGVLFEEKTPKTDNIVAESSRPISETLENNISAPQQSSQPPTEHPSSSNPAIRYGSLKFDHSAITSHEPFISRHKAVYAGPPPISELDDVPIAHIKEHLRAFSTEKGRYHKIAKWIDYLVDYRGEKIGLFHYDMLIRANADAQYGDAKVVRRLLQEMREVGIMPDLGLYHAVLQVLAIHPDYLLRAEILQEMKERWMGLSPDGWHWLVVGLLRDRQYEVAMDKLEQMQTDGLFIQPWLYDIFMFRLCEAGELDEVWKMLLYRWQNDRARISPSVWYYLLDVFSRDFHYEGVKFIWKTRIETQTLRPSDGMCNAVLNLAARHADPQLATSVTKFLSSRRALSPFHYEALLSAYTAADDLLTAFRILVIMSKAGYEPDASHTRPLFLHLRYNIDFPPKAWDVLKQLKEDGHRVPTAAANVVLEAMIHAGGGSKALDMYKDLHTICDSGPNTQTFETLLQEVSRGYPKEVGMFLASEMVALGVKPGQLTYDRLIRVCLSEDDYEDAFRYLDEMMSVKTAEGVQWWLRAGTATSLVGKCIRAKDERGWGLLVEMERRGMENGALRRWAEEFWASGGEVDFNGPPINNGRLRVWKQEKLDELEDGHEVTEIETQAEPEAENLKSPDETLPDHGSGTESRTSVEEKSQQEPPISKANIQTEHLSNVWREKLRLGHEQWSNSPQQQPQLESRLEPEEMPEPPKLAAKEQRRVMHPKQNRGVYVRGYPKSSQPSPKLEESAERVAKDTGGNLSIRRIESEKNVWPQSEPWKRAVDGKLQDLRSAQREKTDLVNRQSHGGERIDPKPPM